MMKALESLMEKYVSYTVSHMPPRSQEFLALLDAQSELLDRGKKYYAISSVVFALSYFNPLMRFSRWPAGFAPGIGLAYHFCRAIDDMADGDLGLRKPFPELVASLRESMRTGQYDNDNTSLLLRGTLREMKKFHYYDAAADISRFLGAMEHEHTRRMEKNISTADELRDLYRNSFTIPQDIAFICMGSRVRSPDVPELAQLQGRMYALNDLAEDLQKGIIFVPKEALPFGISASELHPEMPEIKAWAREELSYGREIVGALKHKKLDLRGRLITWFLRRGIEKSILK